MVHPNNTTNKVLHSTVDILETLQDLIERKYNQDNLYRDVGMEPAEIVIGEPMVISKTPMIAIVPKTQRILDAQGISAGAEIDPFTIDLVCYTSKYETGSQVKEAAKMADIIRQIISDNVRLPDKDGNEKVFHAGYREIEITFENVIVVNEGGNFGIDVCTLTYNLVYGETGY